MQGLVIYNGSSRFSKVGEAALKIGAELTKRNVKMQSLKNNEILNMINENNECSLILPSFIEKPDFVLAWEKDTKLIEMFEKQGIKTFNTSDSIRLCDDKAKMHSKLIGTGIRIPKTIISPMVFFEYDFSKDYYSSIVEQLGEKFILKENVGSFGMQVYQINNYDEFLAKKKDLFNRGFIMQENIKSSYGRDLRVNIVGQDVVGVMLRENKQDFRANITVGGEASMYKASNEILDVAMKAHNALGTYFSGVDILFGENGEPILSEVNSNPNYLSFEEISGINFASIVADYIVGEMK